MKRAVVVCDMWDSHHCVTAARRVAEMAPAVNAFVSQLRRRDTLIIHAPGGCTGFYESTPARDRARRAPFAAAPVPIDWNPWNWEREGKPPQTLVEPGPCSCESGPPCCSSEAGYPWTRQIETIEIAPADAVSDDGQEVYNLLEEESVRDVVVLGVHANVCILGRPYGIRQLVYLRKRPVLCRDLTDSFHRDPRGHDWGTAEIVAHIERYWCPTVSSHELLAS